MRASSYREVVWHAQRLTDTLGARGLAAVGLAIAGCSLLVHTLLIRLPQVNDMQSELETVSSRLAQLQQQTNERTGTEKKTELAAVLSATVSELLGRAARASGVALQDVNFESSIHSGGGISDSQASVRATVTLSSSYIGAKKFLAEVLNRNAHIVLESLRMAPAASGEVVVESQLVFVVGAEPKKVPSASQVRDAQRSNPAAPAPQPTPGR